MVTPISVTPISVTTINVTSISVTSIFVQIAECRLHIARTAGGQWPGSTLPWAQPQRLAGKHPAPAPAPAPSMPPDHLLPLSPAPSSAAPPPASPPPPAWPSVRGPEWPSDGSWRLLAPGQFEPLESGGGQVFSENIHRIC